VKWTISLLAFASSMVMSIACGDPALSAGQGFVAVPGGKVWYRVMGSGPATPLVMLHGGPGGQSCGAVRHLFQSAAEY
jgi:proline iminopeptidase